MPIYRMVEGKLVHLVCRSHRSNLRNRCPSDAITTGHQRNDAMFALLLTDRQIYRMVAQLRERNRSVLTGTELAVTSIGDP